MNSYIDPKTVWSGEWRDAAPRFAPLGWADTAFTARADQPPTQPLGHDFRRWLRPASWARGPTAR